MTARRFAGVGVHGLRLSLHDLRAHGATRLQVVKRWPAPAVQRREAPRRAARAAHKREVSASQIAGIVDSVEAEAAKRGGVIPAERIGELCLEQLGAIDRGAYFQFAGTLPEITPEIGVFAEPDSVRTERGQSIPR